MALQQKRHWTFEEYQERPDELAFAELWDGELIMAPSPLERHQWLAGYLFTDLTVFLRQHPLGRAYIAPFDVRLNPTENRVVHPDVLFVSSQRASIISSKGIEGAPDLVVEVLSPGTRKFDLTEKKAAYEAAGVREYWACYQDEVRLEVYRLGTTRRYGKPIVLKAGDTLTTGVLPGFALSLDDLYQDLPPAEDE